MTTTTANSWRDIINDLSAKQQAAHDTAQRLRTEKSNLALEAAMGSDDARKRMDRINAELTRLSLESGDWDVAIGRAQEQHRIAQEAAAAEAEAARKAQVSAALTQYVSHCRTVDEAMMLLVARFEQAKQARDRAEALMSTEERRGIGYFSAATAAILAAAHYGLGSHVELDGRAISRLPRSAFGPLAEAATHALSGWVEPEQQINEKEQTNGK